MWLALRGWRVTGVDFSSVGLERARTRAREQRVAVDWVLADLLEWRPPAESFDLVMLLFMHLAPEDRRAVHLVAAKAVAPGGTLLIVSRSLEPRRGRWWAGPQDPEVLFTATEIASELSELRIERAETVRGPVGDDRHRVDAVVRALRPVG